MAQQLSDIDEQQMDAAADQDKDAASYMHKGTLRTIQNCLLHLALGLTSLGILLASVFDDGFQDQFFDYLKDSGNRLAIISVAVLMIITYALDQIYTLDKDLSPYTKQTINLIEDILRGTFYILLMILLGMFVQRNQKEKILIIAFIMLICAGSLFFIFRILKWTYFLCGEGKDNLKPWTQQKTKGLTPALKKEIDSYIAKAVQEKKFAVFKGRP